MSSLIWGAWQSQWLSGAKVDFDGFQKHIIVHPEVSSLDIRADVYSAWIDWHEDSGDNQRWPLALRYSGMDPLPGNKETGGTFFLQNGWKLIIDFNKVAVSGVLFSVDYDTAYWYNDTAPLFPAQVSAIVNNVTQTQTVTVAANPTEIAQEILATPITGTVPGSIGEFITKKLLTIAKFIGLR